MTGFYIWGAYGVTFALLALEVIFLIRRAKKAERRGSPAHLI